MNEQQIIDQLADDVRKRLEGEGSGHDWWHIVRVWNMAKRLVAAEGGDRFTIEAAALLHDIADWKFHGGDESAGPRAAHEILEGYQVPEPIITHVCDIIATTSFKGAGVAATPMKTLEGKIVQDADRLDAVGAVGIARTFAYGGHKNRIMYDPTIKPQQHTTKEAYVNSAGPTINHFYEKLLLLKDRMNTATARQIAEERHTYMEAYLTRFFAEWDGTA